MSEVLKCGLTWHPPIDVMASILALLRYEVNLIDAIASIYLPSNSFLIFIDAIASIYALSALPMPQKMVVDTINHFKIKYLQK